jgi:hypothetical protein
MVERHPAKGTPERNQAALRLVTTWLLEDMISVEPNTWEQLKVELDRERPAERKLFR